jgi:hypothetical protein
MVMWVTFAGFMIYSAMELRHSRELTRVSEREARLIKGGFQIENSEQFHAVVRDSILVSNYVDVPVGGPVEDVVNQFRVSDWLECIRRIPG